MYLAFAQTYLPLCWSKPLRRIFFKVISKVYEGKPYPADVYLNVIFCNGPEHLVAEKSWTASCKGHALYVQIWSTTILTSSKEWKEAEWKYSKLKVKRLVYYQTLKALQENHRVWSKSHIVLPANVPTSLSQVLEEDLEPCALSREAILHHVSGVGGTPVRKGAPRWLSWGLLRKAAVPHCSVRTNLHVQLI